MKKGDVYLHNLQKEYEIMLKEQKKELKAMPPGHLMICSTKSGTQYVQILPVAANQKIQPPMSSEQELDKDPSHRYQRKGITKNEYLVKQLARKKYLELSIRQLETALRQLIRFLENYHEPSPKEVLDQLPKSYHQLPEEWFFPEKSAAHRWASLDYQQNTFHEHEKIHVTAKGLRVRSKSELIIAEKLDAYDLAYRYEELIHFGKHTFSPDFVIKTRWGMYYWEHCGMMMDPEYMRRNQWKLSMYEKMGIVPWKNLIVTYDTEDGGLHSAIIEAEIKNKLLM